MTPCLSQGYWETLGLGMFGQITDLGCFFPCSIKPTSVLVQVTETSNPRPPKTSSKPRTVQDFPLDAIAASLQQRVELAKMSWEEER